jgi:hypothetical protein
MVEQPEHRDDADLSRYFADLSSSETPANAVLAVVSQHGKLNAR